MAITETKLIRVGHSPDPDDAFMFYALAKDLIPMRGFRVEHVVEDIEALNQRALKAELEVTAVSCHAYTYLADQYLIMPSGASVGDRYGPILVTRKDQKITSDSIRGKKVAVPGPLTTAYLLLQLFEKDVEVVFVPFDRIFDAVQAGTVDIGLVIHEGQITFEQSGMKKIFDLGQWWYDQYGLPVPLGVDIIRRDLGGENISEFSRLFKESIQFALSHREDAMEYALEFGRGIHKDLGDRFVGMYVNDYTLDLGETGRKGLQKLFDEGFERGIIPKKITAPFVELK